MLFRGWFITHHAHTPRDGATIVYFTSRGRNDVIIKRALFTVGQRFRASSPVLERERVEAFCG
jgi:hypothetical protein